MALNDMQSLLVEQLRDLLSAEKQLVQALPKMAKAAQSPDLQQAFQDHLEATQNHVTRLEQAFAQIDETARARKCKGMEGLILEGSEMIEEKGQPDVKDAGLIAAAQRVEHYEIAAYGTVRFMAHQLGLEGVVQLMDATLDEEKEADRLLSELAESRAKAGAAEADEHEPSEMEEDQEDQSDSPGSDSRPRSGGHQRAPARSGRQTAD